MNESDDNIQASQSLTFEPLGYLANQESLNDTSISIVYLKEFLLEFHFH